MLYARVEKIVTLPPGAFTPPPKVYSTVLRLTMAPRQQELGLDGTGRPSDGFIDFLKLSFGQKRKTLWNNLKSNYPERALRAALAELGDKADFPSAKSVGRYLKTMQGRRVGNYVLERVAHPSKIVEWKVELKTKP